MNELAEWLANNLPASDNEEQLLHGDFRIDNVIFHPKEVSCIQYACPGFGAGYIKF